MGAYVLRRLLLAVPTLIGITAAVFLLAHLSPGGPIERRLMQYQVGAMAGSTSPAASLPPDAIDQMRRFYGFDQPVHVRYARWLWNLLHLDLGRSYIYQAPVWSLLRPRIGVTLLLGVAGFLLAYAIALPLGVMQAARHGSVLDAVGSAITLAFYSVPGWALGTLLLSAGALAFDPRRVFLPIVCYASGAFPVLTTVVRQATATSLQQDYVRAALARGVAPRRALLAHALRNSLVPVVSGLGRVLALVVTGSFLIERVFNVDGAGYLGYTAMVQHDYPVALGIAVAGSVAMVLGNLASDLLVAAIDPRVRFK